MERALLLAKKYEHLSQSRDTATESNVSHLPTAKVKSGAVESLLSQNEDLNARIKVLLRRLSLIEEENLTLSHEHREMKNQLNGLLDQSSVFRDKEAKWRERTLLAEESLEIQQSQIRQKEIEFAKLRAQEWETRTQLQEEMQRLEISYHRLLRYRIRIKNWVQPAIRHLKSLVNEKNIKIEAVSRQLQKAEIQCHNIVSKNLQALKEARDHLKQSEEEKIHIISQFEQQRRDLESEIQNLKESSEEYRKKAAHLDRSLERQDFLENRLIYAERENKELRAKYIEEFTLVQSQMYEWRNRAQKAEVETKGISEEKTELLIELQKSKESSTRLSEQMEAMRTLWQEKVRENEKLRSKNQTLDALNSELSIKVRTSDTKPT